MNGIVEELKAELKRALTDVGAELPAHELVDRPYSFYYRCGLSKEGKAVSVGKITAIEFEEDVGIILRISHTRLNGGIEVRGIIYVKGEWSLVTCHENRNDYYPGSLEIH